MGAATRGPWAPAWAGDPEELNAARDLIGAQAAHHVRAVAPFLRGGRRSPVLGFCCVPWTLACVHPLVGRPCPGPVWAVCGGQWPRWAGGEGCLPVGPSCFLGAQLPGAAGVRGGSSGTSRVRWRPHAPWPVSPSCMSAEASRCTLTSYIWFLP